MIEVADNIGFMLNADRRTLDVGTGASNPFPFVTQLAVGG